MVLLCLCGGCGEDSIFSFGFIILIWEGSGDYGFLLVVFVFYPVYGMDLNEI